MGKYGIAKGYGYFQNHQAGRATLTTDSNGDGSTSIVFTRKFKNIPSIVCTSSTSDDTIVLCTTANTTAGFTIEADAASVTGDTFTISWQAVDDTRPSKN